MAYNEPEVIDLIKRMIAIYLEGYPTDKEELERFQTWVLIQWGYKDGQA